MTSSLVGSEMCIRDREASRPLSTHSLMVHVRTAMIRSCGVLDGGSSWSCLLYTSDAADDM
eukprot:4963879-Prorocentrum_lima.AAC.1